MFAPCTRRLFSRLAGQVLALGLCTLVSPRYLAAAGLPAAVACPSSVYLQTVPVRVYETSDAAHEMLQLACRRAAQRSFSAWQQQALRAGRTSVCAAQMGFEGCLMGQPSRQLRCRADNCALSQKCTVTLVWLPAAKPVPQPGTCAGRPCA
jgi:hypothetical protein